MAIVKIYNQNNRTVIDDGKKIHLIEMDYAIDATETFVTVFDKNNKTIVWMPHFGEIQDKAGAIIAVGGSPAIIIEAVLDYLDMISASALAVAAATEATLLSVLNAIVASDQDIEILLVRDLGDGGVVVQQITNYETGVPVVSYKNVDGTVHTVIGPLEYLDPSAVQNLILAESTSQGLTLDSIDTNIAAATRTHNTINTAIAGSVSLGSIAGSVLNVGDEDGTWNGTVIPAGVSIPWGHVANRDTYSAIAYDPTTPGTGTTFIIEYTT